LCAFVVLVLASPIVAHCGASILILILHAGNAKGVVVVLIFDTVFVCISIKLLNVKCTIAFTIYLLFFTNLLIRIPIQPAAAFYKHKTKTKAAAEFLLSREGSLHRHNSPLSYNYNKADDSMIDDS
jgi:hypothetical protein